MTAPLQHKGDGHRSRNGTGPGLSQPGIHGHRTRAALAVPRRAAGAGDAERNDRRPLCHRLAAAAAGGASRADGTKRDAAAHPQGRRRCAHPPGHVHPSARGRVCPACQVLQATAPDHASCAVGQETPAPAAVPVVAGTADRGRARAGLHHGSTPSSTRYDLHGPRLRRRRRAGRAGPWLRTRRPSAYWTAASSAESTGCSPGRSIRATPSVACSASTDANRLPLRLAPPQVLDQRPPDAAPPAGDRSATVISVTLFALAFLCPLAGAGIGMALRRRLPGASPQSRNPSTSSSWRWD